MLESVMADVKDRFGFFLKNILTASTEHGAYGMQMVDALHTAVPATTCANCGSCCNSISIFSLEYHLIVRDLMSRLPPQRIRDIFKDVLLIETRLAEIGPEKRLRCSFREEQAKVCLVHPARPFACRFYGMLKEDGTRECDRVWDLGASEPITDVQIAQFQKRIMENSEFHQPWPDKPEIAFFPFEFWAFRYALGPEKALEIYRDILVPASSALTQFWAEEFTDKRQKTDRNIPAMGCVADQPPRNGEKGQG